MFASDSRAIQLSLVDHRRLGQRRERLLSSRMRQKVVVVVPKGGSLFEIATPMRVWGADPHEPRWPAVDLEVCSTGEATVPLAVSGLSLTGMAGVEATMPTADMVVVPTWPVDGSAVPHELSAPLLEAHERGARVVGLCLGAFVLAEIGLLDGRTAVTHWRYGDEFEARFPNVTLERDPLYIDHGSVVTSAGSAAALDCCLHLIRSDHGAQAAAVVARSLVTAPHRSGGQSQFAATDPKPVPDDDALGVMLASAVSEIGDVSNVTDLVSRVPVGRRTLERLLRGRMGTTPRAWLVEQRVRGARALLEDTTAPIDRVASQVGFGSSATLRREFRRILGTTPTEYRRAFQSTTR